MKEITFDSEEISIISSIVDNKELITDEEKEIFKELKSKFIFDDYNLALFFLNAFDKLSMVSDSLQFETNDFREKVKLYVKEALSKLEIIEFRKRINLIKRIDGGIGSSEAKDFLYNVIEKDRDYFNNFVNYFGQFMKLGE